LVNREEENPEMSHHDHPHPHEHDHGHDKHHHQHEKHLHHEHGDPSHPESQAKPSERAKLIKVLEHWIHHNEEHAKSYGEWAKRARSLGEEAIGSILDGIAAETVRQNEKFQEALKLMNSEAAPR
jgi:hypothetical protein